MATQGATFFFDRDADFASGYTSTLRSEFLFGDIADGTGGSEDASRDVYMDLVRGVPSRT